MPDWVLVPRDGRTGRRLVPRERLRAGITRGLRGAQTGDVTGARWTSGGACASWEECGRRSQSGQINTRRPNARVNDSVDCVAFSRGNDIIATVMCEKTVDGWPTENRTTINGRGFRQRMPPPTPIR
jgi:hypothetical protein